MTYPTPRLRGPLAAALVAVGTLASPLAQAADGPVQIARISPAEPAADTATTRTAATCRWRGCSASRSGPTPRSRFS